MSKPAQRIPVVGMGATMCVGSDSYAFTIIEVSASKKRIKIQEDKATRIDNNGMYSEAQDYFHEYNTNGTIYTVSLRKDGRWRISGESKGMIVSIGYRRTHRDPHF